MSNLCVYLHFRADDGFCFYVGMGSIKRSHDFRNRSDYWKRVRDKHGVKVQIACIGLSFDEAVCLERSFIAQLSHSSSARLVNLTSGGEGTTGVKNSEVTKQRKSESAIKLNADPTFRQKKLKQLAATREPVINAKRSQTQKMRLQDPRAKQKHMAAFSKIRAPIEVARAKCQTSESKSKRASSIRRYLTSPDTRHVGLMKTALMNAARWKRPYTKLPKDYFDERS